MLRGLGLRVFGLGLKQPSIEVRYRVLNFNTGLDPRFKISGKLFCGALNLESWIPASIEVQYPVLKFNTWYGTSTISLNFNTGLDPRFKILGKLFCGALNLQSWIQARVLSSIIVLNLNAGFRKPKP